MSSPSNPEERLAAHLKAGVAALRKGAPTQAVLHLTAVAEDEGLAQAHDLRDIRARACSLLAQGLLDLGRLDDADRWLGEADTLAQGLEEEGEAPLRELRERLSSERDKLIQEEQRRQRSERIASSDIEPFLNRVKGQAQRAQLLIEKANAEADADRSESARGFAERALAEALEAGSTRGVVLAHLSLARCAPQLAERHLAEALSHADRARDTTLIQTIVRAAEVAEVPLPTQAGPIGSTP